jgi:catechol 2,3-dioxygenase-like lactoylglutathione lyase family enzyme
MAKIKLKAGPIQIFVSDLKRAKKWYIEILGMELVEEYPEFQCILLRLGDIEFDLGVPNSTWGKGWDKIRVGGRIPIFFETKNIKKTWEELKKKGIKVVEELSRKPWGEMSAVFADPDGNEFTLIEEVKSKL